MHRISKALVVVLFACLGLSGCSNGVAAILVVYDQDVVLAVLALNPADTARTENSSEVRVTGDATIDGTLEATDGLLKLVVLGDLTINGIIRSLHTSPPDPDTMDTFRNQVSGICIRVAGNVTFGPNAMLRSNGPVIITDTDAELDKVLQDVYDETDSASGSHPTLVPLDPSDPVFGPQTTSNVASTSRVAQGGGLPILVRGTWDLSGLPGDQPVTRIFFNGGRELQFDGWTLIPPAAPPGAGANPQPGNPGFGNRGGNGMNVNIWNNNGRIRFVNNVTVNLSDGGRGGDAQTTCSTAEGGDGGKSGNLRITASAGIVIDAVNGALIINPGRSGDGGAAIVLKGAPGADGCPGAPGDDSSATGGDGGDNRKRLFIRGSVSNVGRIQYGTVEAGDGGDADAIACDGGDGGPCWEGGDGGDADATGGDGGDASLNLGGTGVQHTGDVIGGDGGNATAEGGDGGDGGKCWFLPGGDGGAGGSAVATTGDGGDATAAGGAVNAMGGDAGFIVGDAASATGGDGGAGGDALAAPGGTGGAMGAVTATAGQPGTPGGLAGATATFPGMKGPDGNTVAPVTFCIPVLPWVQIGPPVNAGPYPNHPVDNSQGQNVGSIDTVLRDNGGGQFRGNPGPDHLEIQGPAEIEVQLESLSLVSAPPVAPVLVGMELVPLNAEGIDAMNPLQVELLDSQLNTLNQIDIDTVPNNEVVVGLPGGTNTPVQIPFGQLSGPVSIAIIRVPAMATLRIIKITLVDP